MVLPTAKMGKVNKINNLRCMVLPTPPVAFCAMLLQARIVPGMRLAYIFVYFSLYAGLHTL